MSAVARTDSVARSTHLFPRQRVALGAERQQRSVLVLHARGVRLHLLRGSSVGTSGGRARGGAYRVRSVQAFQQVLTLRLQYNNLAGDGDSTPRAGDSGVATTHRLLGRSQARLKLLFQLGDLVLLRTRGEWVCRRVQARAAHLQVRSRRVSAAATVFELSSQLGTSRGEGGVSTGGGRHTQRTHLLVLALQRFVDDGQRLQLLGRLVAGHSAPPAALRRSRARSCERPAAFYRSALSIAALARAACAGEPHAARTQPPSGGTGREMGGRHVSSCSAGRRWSCTAGVRSTRASELPYD